MSVHDIDCARWLLAIAAPRARVRRGDPSPSTKACAKWRRRRQRRGDLRIRRRRDRLLLRVAHDGARFRDARRRSFGTAGRLTVWRVIRGSTSSTSPTCMACATNARRRSYERVRGRVLARGAGIRRHGARRTDRRRRSRCRDATEATRIGIALRESMRTKRVIEFWKNFKAPLA